jgi:ribosomal protein S8
MAKGRAQLRRIRKLGKLVPEINQQIFDQAKVGQDSYMSAILPEFQQLQGLADVFRSEMTGPYTDTLQGQGFLNTIEQQSDQARESLQNQASLLGMSDESVLAGQQNISKSEGDRMRSLMELGEQSRVNARRGFGNVLNNLLGQRSAGFNVGYTSSQNAMNFGRGIQQQAGNMATGILTSFMQGAEGIAKAVATKGAG